MCNVVLCKTTYSHSNGIDLSTGLNPLDNFKPVINLVHSKTDTEVFLTMEEWYSVYKSLKGEENSTTSENDFNRNNFYILLYCIKRCAHSVIFLIIEAINKFKNCIHLRMQNLHNYNYQEAKSLINIIESICKSISPLSVSYLRSILELYKTGHSVVEEEMLQLCDSFFIHYIYKYLF